jgi:hypothetical protein
MCCAYRKSHPTFRRLHLQDLPPDTTHRLSNLDFVILLLVYSSLPSPLFPYSLFICASSYTDGGNPRPSVAESQPQ